MRFPAVPPFEFLIVFLVDSKLWLYTKIVRVSPTWFGSPNSAGDLNPLPPARNAGSRRMLQGSCCTLAPVAGGIESWCIPAGAPATADHALTRWHRTGQSVSLSIFRPSVPGLRVFKDKTRRTAVPRLLGHY